MFIGTFFLIEQKRQKYRLKYNIFACFIKPIEFGPLFENFKKPLYFLTFI